LAEARLLVELLEEGRLDPVARLQHRLALVLVYDGVHHLREMLPEVRRHLSYVLRVFRDLQIQPPFDVLHRDPHDVLFGQLVLKRDWSLDAFPFLTFFYSQVFLQGVESPVELRISGTRIVRSLGSRGVDAIDPDAALGQLLTHEDRVVHFLLHDGGQVSVAEFLGEDGDEHGEHLVDFGPPLLEGSLPFFRGGLFEAGDVVGDGLEAVARRLSVAV
jgi:hypothetical protein